MLHTKSWNNCTIAYSAEQVQTDNILWTTEDHILTFIYKTHKIETDKMIKAAAAELLKYFYYA